LKNNNKIDITRVVLPSLHTKTTTYSASHDVHRATVIAVDQVMFNFLHLFTCFLKSRQKMFSYRLTSMNTESNVNSIGHMTRKAQPREEAAAPESSCSLTRHTGDSPAGPQSGVARLGWTTGPIWQHSIRGSDTPK
jgi:hypothetical protein